MFNCTKLGNLSKYSNKITKWWRHIRIRHKNENIVRKSDTLLRCQPSTWSRTPEVGLLQRLQHGPSRQFVPNNSRRTARALPVRPHVLCVVIVAQLWRLFTSIRWRSATGGSTWFATLLRFVPEASSQHDFGVQSLVHERRVCWWRREQPAIRPWYGTTRRSYHRTGTKRSQMRDHHQWRQRGRKLPGCYDEHSSHPVRWRDNVGSTCWERVFSWHGS